MNSSVNDHPTFEVITLDGLFFLVPHECSLIGSMIGEWHVGCLLFDPLARAEVLVTVTWPLLSGRQINQLAGQISGANSRN